MANFSFSAVQPTALTNLNATATGLTVSFTWDAQGLDEKVEVWKSADTTQADAVLIAATWDHNFQESENAGGNTAYYWLRKVNTLQGGQNGPWSSMITVSVTGVTATVTTVSDGSITPAKLSSGFAIDPSTGNLKTGVVGVTNLSTTSLSGLSPSISGSTSSGNVTTANTWQSFVSASFTPTAHSYYSAYVWLAVTAGTPSFTSAGQSAQVQVRFRLHDNTTSTDVPGYSPIQMIYYATYFGAGMTSVYVNKTWAEANLTFSEGFKGQLVAGHSYTIYGEVMVNSFITASVNAGNSAANGGGTYS